MSFWDESFFNYSVPYLNEEPHVEYSYGTIDLNAESNADVGFDSQASYGFVYDDSKQSNPEEGYEEKPAASNVNWETKEAECYFPWAKCVCIRAHQLRWVDGVSWAKCTKIGLAVWAHWRDWANAAILGRNKRMLG
ncbi:hypothetical protein E3N88_26174 [Mikania micrantha]|uniref:Uncharacterized protein n=1 Tax=Mikania micrantha TaxID=192012 RepID=A0A5N6N6T1_9ASTR|nr:hypothetical protein E3N88_26174 [Mikania micrantha]